MRTRFIASILKTAQDCDVVLPWARKPRRTTGADTSLKTAAS